MAQYKLTTTNKAEQFVDADRFETEGDFVDFTRYQDGDNVTVLRFRKESVLSIELQSADD